MEFPYQKKPADEENQAIEEKRKCKIKRMNEDLQVRAMKQVLLLVKNKCLAGGLKHSYQYKFEFNELNIKPV